MVELVVDIERGEENVRDVHVVLFLPDGFGLSKPKLSLASVDPAAVDVNTTNATNR